MKIAIIRKKYTFHGGAEGFSSSFIENLANDGHEIHIFAIKWQSETTHEHIHFHKVPALTFLSFLRDFTFAFSSYFMLRKQRVNFDIIQTHDKTLYQDIYRAGDGCHIEWLRQRWKRTGPGGKISIILNPYHWLILLLERAIFRGQRYNKIIAISQMVKKNIMENYGIPSPDIEVIYNGVDLEKYTPQNREIYRSEIRQKYGLSDKDFVALFVGSGFERKGVPYLIDAVETISDSLSLMIVGKGKHLPVPPPGKAGIKGGSIGKNQNIIFCGPQKEIQKYYAAADIFVFPTMYEPFGNVHLEALAAGLPVITTKNSGASEIIKNGEQGYVVNAPEDVQAIAEKITFLLQNSEAREAMGRNARNLAEEFSFNKHISKIKKLYESIINEKNSK